MKIGNLYKVGSDVYFYNNVGPHIASDTIVLLLKIQKLPGSKVPRGYFLLPFGAVVWKNIFEGSFLSHFFEV